LTAFTSRLWAFYRLLRLNQFCRWNHTSCGKGFRLDSFRIFDALNSQLQEQANAKTVDLRFMTTCITWRFRLFFPFVFVCLFGFSACYMSLCDDCFINCSYICSASLSYMTQERFINSLMLFYAGSNASKIAAVRANTESVREVRLWLSLIHYKTLCSGNLFN